MMTAVVRSGIFMPLRTSLASFTGQQGTQRPSSSILCGGISPPRPPLPLMTQFYRGDNSRSRVAGLAGWRRFGFFLPALLLPGL